MRIIPQMGADPYFGFGVRRKQRASLLKFVL
jgi:hypothetical protein